LVIPGYEDAVEIGRGGFGIVYRARQTDVQRTVAIKVLTGVFDEHARLRFDRERDAMGLLSSHPNSVTVHASGFTADGSPFIVMEYLDGASLADRLVRGPLPWRQAVEIGVKLAGALEAAHRAGVLHRDVKPENVLISAYGAPKLADFGIARLEGGPETRSGSITASLYHAAPEVFEGKRPTAATDVYSLASTVFSLITARAPFARETDESIVPLFARVASEPVPDLRPSGVPDVVCSVLEAGMAKDPAERIGSARGFGLRLQAAQRALGLDVTPRVGADARPIADTPRPPVSEVAPRDPTARIPTPAAPNPVVRAPTPHATPLPTTAPGRPRDRRGARIRTATIATGIVVAAALLAGLLLLPDSADPKREVVSAAPLDPTCVGHSPLPVDQEVREVWRSPDAARLPGQVRSNPIALGNLVVVATDRGTVAGFDGSKEGTEVFRNRLDGPVVGDPALDARAGYFATTAGGLYRVDPSAPARVRRILHTDRPLGGVAVFKERAYVARRSADGGVLVVELRTGKVLRTIATEGVVFGQPIVDSTSEALYFADDRGVVHRLSVADDTSDGRVQRFDAAGPVEAGLTIAGGRLIAATVDGDVQALDPTTGREVWRWHREAADHATSTSGVYSRPAAVGENVVFTTSDCRITALDGSGNELWTTSQLAPIRAVPATVAGASFLAPLGLVAVADSSGEVEVLQVSCEGKRVRSGQFGATVAESLAWTRTGLVMGTQGGQAVAMDFDPLIQNDAC
jgi:outer membrane protein assembly factor BamB